MKNLNSDIFLAKLLKLYFEFFCKSGIIWFKNKFSQRFKESYMFLVKDKTRIFIFPENPKMKQEKESSINKKSEKEKNRNTLNKWSGREQN
jgi:hypothetical protein